MLEFRSPLATTRQEKVKRTTITFSKKAKVTTILFPDNYSQEKDSKSFFTEIKEEDGNLLYAFVQWEEGMPSDKLSKYNIGDNSINSTPIVEKLQELYDTEAEEFNCEVVEKGGYKLLIVVSPKETATEEVVNDTIAVKDELEEAYEEEDLIDEHEPEAVIEPAVNFDNF